MNCARSVLLIMVVSLLASGLARAQQHGSRSGGGNHRGPLGLLQMPEVQRELRLEEVQIEQVQQLDQEMRTKAVLAFPSGLPMMSREERDRKFHELHAETDRRLADILDGRQRARLRQLDLQSFGPRALGRKDVQDELKLSMDQRQRIRDATEAEKETMHGIALGAAHEMTPDQRLALVARFHQAHKATDEKLLGILTESQRKQFDSMQGTPFPFPSHKPRLEAGA